MSPTQESILAYLRERSPAIIGGYELRDAACPLAGVKAVHVQVWRLRRSVSEIETVRGLYGGYRIRRAA